MNDLVAAVNSNFFQRALIEAVLVGATGGVVGVHILLRRLSFYVAALSHATLPGLVLASSVGVSTFVGGWLCGLLVAVAVTIASRSKGISDASAIGVVLSGTFAIGVLLLTAGIGGDNRDFAGFLVGSILTVDNQDLTITAVVAITMTALALLFHKELVLTAFDPKGSGARGYRVGMVDFVVLLAVTVVVVTVIPAVGTLLSIAVLTIPALTARQWCSSVGRATVLAAVIGAVGTTVGLLASSLWAVAAGGAIALTLAALFVLSVGLRTCVIKLAS